MADSSRRIFSCILGSVIGKGGTSSVGEASRLRMASLRPEFRPIELSGWLHRNTFPNHLLVNLSTVKMALSAGDKLWGEAQRSYFFSNG